jgi:hypothetical protein
MQITKTILEFLGSVLHTDIISYGNITDVDLLEIKTLTLPNAYITSHIHHHTHKS